MKKLILTFATFALFAAPVFASVPCVVIGPSATGSGTGADWNDIKAKPSSGSYAYGTRYYLEDGTYGSLSIGAPSGSGSSSNVVELRKAQAWDYGRTSDGCTTDVSAGWNASTMGAAQAVFDWTSAGRFFNIGTSGYITVNGNAQSPDPVAGCGGIEAGHSGTNYTQAPPVPTGCGIKIDSSTCTSTATDGCDSGSGEAYMGGADITIEYVEWKSSGLNTNGNNNQEAYFWWAASTTGMLVTHNYMHNFATTCITNAGGGWNSATVDYNFVWGGNDSSTNHGECFQDTGSDSGTTINHNIFLDWITNGILVFVDPTTGTHDSFSFYDNVDSCTSGNTCRHNDGFIACINSSQTCTNMLVYNNTLINLNTNSGIVCTNACTTSICENNLFYSTASASLGACATSNYNSWLNTSGGNNTGANVSVTSGAPNPFVGWPAYNFRLASENADWSSRVSLGSPYDTADLYGNAYTTDRGAAQYVSSLVTGSAYTSGYTVGLH